jgi:hypothetical protein
MSDRSLDERLAELAGLPDDWNSYGAKRITNEAITTAERLNFTPTSPGGLQIELHVKGASVEVEIGPDGRILCVDFDVREVADDGQP